MKALITAGGTCEDIDSVRSIINHSTGRLGSIIADLFAREKADVTYVCGEKAVVPVGNNIKIIKVKNTQELLETLASLLEADKFDCIVHSMAVSDFTPHAGLTLDNIIKSVASALRGQDLAQEELENIIRGAVLDSGKILDNKISSKNADMMLWLKQTPKIIGQLRAMQPDTVLVGFKLLSDATEEELMVAGKNLLIKNYCDYVLANDLRDINGDMHKALLIDEHKILCRAETKQEIAQAIYKAVSEKICRGGILTPVRIGD